MGNLNRAKVPSFHKGKLECVQTQIHTKVKVKVSDLNVNNFIKIQPINEIMSCPSFMTSFKNAQASALIQVGPSLVVSSGQ